MTVATVVAGEVAGDVFKTREIAGLDRTEKKSSHAPCRSECFVQMDMSSAPVSCQIPSSSFPAEWFSTRDGRLVRRTLKIVYE